MECFVLWEQLLSFYFWKKQVDSAWVKWEKKNKHMMNVHKWDTVVDVDRMVFPSNKINYIQIYLLNWSKCSGIFVIKCQRRYSVTMHFCCVVTFSLLISSLYMQAISSFCKTLFITSKRNIPCCKIVELPFFNFEPNIISYQYYLICLKTMWKQV